MEACEKLSVLSQCSWARYQIQFPKSPPKSALSHRESEVSSSIILSISHLYSSPSKHQSEPGEVLICKGLHKINPMMAPYSLKFRTPPIKTLFKDAAFALEIRGKSAGESLKVKLPMMCLLFLHYLCSLGVFLLRAGEETADKPAFASSLKPPDQ